LTHAILQLDAEHLLHDLAASEATWRMAILRYFNPVGAHPSGLIGENPNGLPNNLMPYVARVAAGQLPHLNVWGNDYPTPDGNGVRDYIHVVDLAEGHLAALKHLATPHALACDVFNLGTGQGTSVLQIVRAFEQASGCPVPLHMAPRRPGDVAACWANPAKAQQVLGWRASRGLADMCHSAWRFQAPSCA
jgi:UDP-glucose 4-epimerase